MTARDKPATSHQIIMQTNTRPQGDKVFQVAKCLHIGLNRLIMGCLVITVFATHTALARDPLPYEAELGLIRGVTLDVVDEVTGDCWTNAESIRSKLHLLLEQNDVRVLADDEEMRAVNMEAARSGDSVFTAGYALAYATGFRNGDWCTIYATFEVAAILPVFYPRLNRNFHAHVSLFNRGGIITDRTNADIQLRDFFERGLWSSC